MGNPTRYNDVLNLARQSGAISEAEFEELIPQVVSSSPTPKEFVDTSWLDLQLQEQLAGMQLGEIARSKMFTTQLFPAPIDRTAFDVSIKPRRNGWNGRD